MQPTKKLTVGLNAALSFDRFNNILLLFVMHARLELSVVHQVPASAPVSILQVTVLFYCLLARKNQGTFIHKNKKQLQNTKMKILSFC